MTNIERALVGTLFALYLYECVFWLSLNQKGFTRTAGADWREWQIGPQSFTLAGRTPVLVSPLLARPGFIRSAGAEPAARILRRVGKRLDALRLLSLLCRGQAFLMLVGVPVFIFLHLLAPFWPYLLALLLPIHLVLCISVIRVLRRNKTASLYSLVTSIVLNPLGATRALDIISQHFFEEEQKKSSGSLPREASTLTPASSAGV
jgi:hypothetical protein